MLGHNLRERFAGYNGVCLVDHPLLAHILAPVCRVAYIHGEIAAPGVSAVPDAWRTFVPLEATRQKLLAVGCEPSAVVVTGLLVEPDLVAAADALGRRTGYPRMAPAVLFALIVSTLFIVIAPTPRSSHSIGAYTAE